MFPPSLLLLCVLISTGWEPVHVDSPLYDNRSQYISWDKHKTKTVESTGGTQAHQLNHRITEWPDLEGPFKIL